MVRVRSAKAFGGYRLRLVFDDGAYGEVDCSFLLRGTLGAPLIEPEYFGRVRVDEEAGTVVWPNGLDPAPELLRELVMHGAG